MKKMVISSEIYILIIFLGLMYGAVREIFEFDVPVFQTITVGIPAGLIGWGILGLITGGSEPMSFIIGLVCITLFVSLLMSMILVSYDEAEEFIGFTGTVNIPIPPDGLGKIAIDTPRGKEFYVARAYNPISKPMPQSSWIKIVKFEGTIVHVVQVDPEEGNTPNIMKREKKNKKMTDPLMVYLKNRNKKSDSNCGICYSNITNKTKLVICSNCESNFHKEHIEDWLIIEGNCPNCRSKVKLESGRMVKV
jgi:hypothetical protein